MIRAVARRAWGLSRRLRHRARVEVRSHWVGDALHTRLALPERLPAPGVLVVPGLGGTAASVERWDQPVCLAELASAGVVAMAIDLSGRGASRGEEDHGGPRHQEDVRIALAALAALPGVTGPLGIVSLSLGCAAVAGALASGSRPMVGWWIDWEGPSDREIITAGGRILDPAMGHSLGDDAYWHPREAVRHVGRTGVPYLRYQSSRDHAQPGELRHAERMVRAASEGDPPWFQLNDHRRGELPARPVWMPGGTRPTSKWLHQRIGALTRSTFVW